MQIKDIQNLDSLEAESNSLFSRVLMLLITQLKDIQNLDSLEAESNSQTRL